MFKIAFYCEEYKTNLTCEENLHSNFLFLTYELHFVTNLADLGKF